MAGSRRAFHSAAVLLAATLCLAMAPAGAAEAPWIGETLDGEQCSGAEQGYGPFDYTNRTHVRDRLPIVERHHFTDRVASLKGGQGGGLLADLDYTIRAFPNHHRALYAVVRLFTQEAGNQGLDQWPTPPECYLQRAARFAPRDHVVHMLFGIYLHRLDHHERAERMYRRAVEINPRSAEAHYNFGLLLIELGQYQDARTHARAAYEQGYPLPGLRRRLAEAGYPL